MLGGRSIELAHRLEELGIRVSLQESIDIHTSLNHVISRAEHETRDAFYCSNLLAVLNTLDRFDLRDDTDVIVRRLHLVGIVGVERLGHSRSEGPGTE